MTWYWGWGSDMGQRYKFTLDTQDGSVQIFRTVRRPRDCDDHHFWCPICAFVAARFEHLTGLVVEKIRYERIDEDVDVVEVRRAA